MKCILNVKVHLVALMSVLMLNIITSVNLNLRNKRSLNDDITPMSELKNLINHNLAILNENVPLKNYASISFKDDKYKLNNKKQEEDDIVAEVYFYKTIMEEGWDKLSMSTYRSDGSFSPLLQAYMGGYLEGRLTFQDTNNFLMNMEYNLSKQDPNLRIVKTIKTFFTNVDQNMYINIDKFNTVYKTEEEREYYYHIYVFYAQFHGMLRGHNKSVELYLKSNPQAEGKIRKITVGDLHLLQADGEIPELMRYFAYKISGRIYKLGDVDYFKNVFRSPDNNIALVWGRLMMTSRCSAMIKILKDRDGIMTDLLAGHTAWSEYTETYRTVKHYYMELTNYKGEKSTIETTFSSYPGFISSSDDYYVTNNGLMVTETTLEVIDINLYNSAKKEDTFIPNSFRINSATFFSKTAEEWVNNFSFFNSGTYSSQWMVLDYNVFEKAKKVNAQKDKLLYVLEQTPNSIITHDVSEYLYENSYYASFNRAFFSETQESMNLQLIKELYGDIFTFKGAQRGKIFKRMEKGVKNFRNFKNVMRYNGYKLNLQYFQDDPSNNSPGHGISSRFDLEERELNNLSGGIDCKLTNSELASKLTSVIQSGPTTENNENLPVFDWNNFKDRDQRIVGLPQKYDFSWILASPENIKFNRKDNYEFSKSK